MRGFVTIIVLVASVFLGVGGNVGHPPNVYPQPILLDDMDTSLGSEIVKAYRGTYAPCMADAYNQQYHHDWSKCKDFASFTFRFAPPADGCYALEEHHPGKSIQCSQYLPRNARLDVEYCKGKSSTIYINQAIGGGQWNEIATLPFLKGYEGRLTMRNSLNETCEFQGNCYWVVDAFRLTWKGNDCSSGNRSKEALQTEDSTKGILLLRLNIADGDDTVSMQMKIQNQKALLEATLATHFGYKSVNIVEARFVESGRRLREKRIALMQILFIAREKMTGSTGVDLKQALQANLDAISPGIAVDSASVEWSLAVHIRTKHDPENTTMGLLFYICIGGVAGHCAACVMLFIAGILVSRLRVFRVRISNVKTVITQSLEAEHAKDKLDKEADCWSSVLIPVQTVGGQSQCFKQALAKEVLEDSKNAKKVDDVENCSVSTGPPASDDGTQSARISIPGSVQKDE